MSFPTEDRGNKKDDCNRLIVFTKDHIKDVIHHAQSAQAT